MMSFQRKKLQRSRPTNHSGRRAILLGLIIFPQLYATPVLPQVVGYGRSSTPIFGGTGLQPTNPFQPMQGTYEKAHTTPDGKPCISVVASARHQAVNQGIIDQIVLVGNACGHPIRVQVCYVKSSDCIVVALQGYQRLERVLGIDSVSTQFRYEYRELF